MSCSPYDLRDYLFGELPEEHRRQVDLHSKTCAVCREELNRFLVTQAALLSIRDEEIPQRIGFVSDKVYEPSMLRRWWQTFWASGPRLAFASAAMLSAAILVFALNRPAATPIPIAASIDVAKLQADFSHQLNVAVEKAVADSEARHAEEAAQLLAAAERRFEAQRKNDIEVVSQAFALLKKQVNHFYVASNQWAGAQ